MLRDSTLADVVVIGAQECKYTLHKMETSQGGAASSPAKSDKEDWVAIVSAHFTGMGYSRQCCEHFWQMRLLVFVRDELSDATESLEVRSAALMKSRYFGVAERERERERRLVYGSLSSRECDTRD